MSAPAVLQINVSRGGVPKWPVPEANATANGLIGDSWAHPKIHGGPRQAVLLIASEGLDELSALGFRLYPGALGENITTRGLDRRAVRFSQRYRIGEAIIQITKLRSPCSTLDVYGNGIQAAIFDAQARAGNPSSPRWGLSGYYAAVTHAGRIRTGDPIALLD